MQDSSNCWQFFLGIVNIIGILLYKIPKYAITNSIYFDRRFTILWLRSVFKQYFDDWLVSFKQQDRNFFSKTEKEIILQQTRKGPYIYEVNMEVRWGVLIFVTCLQVFLLLNRRSIVHFYRWRGWRGLQNWTSCKKCMTPKYMIPKWFKITTNSIIKGISFFFKIKQARYIFTA